MEGKSRPSWLTKGYNAIYTNVPLVKAITYFNINAGSFQTRQPDWTLNRQQDINAYANILSDPRFQGHIP